jgi:DNA polymerase
MRKTLAINANRGRIIALPGALKAIVTVHPSYLLRLREERDKRREFDRLVKDLHLAAEEARKPGA